MEWEAAASGPASLRSPISEVNGCHCWGGCGFLRSVDMETAVRLSTLLLLLSCSTTSHTAPRDRGPWLQQVRSDGAMVVWESREPTDGRVAFGLSPQTLDRIAGSEAPARRHEVRLEGLPPGSLVHYRLLSGRGEGSFRVAPRDGEGVTRIWVLGDTGTGSEAQRRVRDSVHTHLQGQRPDFLVHVGDIAYNRGTDEEFQKHFFDVYGDELRLLPIWPAFGNHEARSTDPHDETGPWFDVFVLPTKGEAGGLPSGREAWYAFDWGAIHFVVLDSTAASRSPDGPMLTWLEADLAASKAKWKIAVFHHPPYSKGTTDSDRQVESVEMRENALPILEAGGVDLVLSGHSHGYERSFLIQGAFETPSFAEGKILDGQSPFDKGDRGTVYVVAGNGGASVGGRFGHPLVEIGEAAFGSVILEIEGDVLRAIHLRADGTVGDSFVIRKGPVSSPSSP